MRRLSRSNPVNDPTMPPELEARIATLEQTDRGEDFDALSWFWMALFGIVLPITLLCIGWRL
jgi:hypothetical protein